MVFPFLIRSRHTKVYHEEKIGAFKLTILKSELVSDKSINHTIGYT